ncbi:ketoacyl-synt-domain-containing protein [Thozetella sp. PMI_491]|nr:ketoacyl-synt-domain-containing protein [Thozetella sp. PMI_491]
MLQDTVFLFGDQAGELLPCIEEVQRLSISCKVLRDFLQESTQRLRSCIFKAPSQFRHHVSVFESVLDLANQLNSNQSHNSYGILRTPLLCVAQLGSLIHHLNFHPGALQSVNYGKFRITGICTGLVTAAAVSSCTTLTEVVAIAGDIVDFSFQVGLEAFFRSEDIDRSSGSWSTVISHVSINDARMAIDLFNEAKGDLKSHWAYISAEGINSVTISGPPSTTRDLFKRTPLFHSARIIPLSIKAAFHAKHLEPLSWIRCAEGVDSVTLNRPLCHHLLSPSSGKEYPGKTLSAVLVDVLGDISQHSVSLKGLCDGIYRSMEKSQGAGLYCFGPVASTKSIKTYLHSLSFDLHDVEIGIPRAQSFDNEIAIIGMSVRLPGSETLEEFWKVLEDGRDLHETIRPDRFDVSTHCDPTGKVNNTTLTPYGVFIDRPGYFDTRLFNMSPREAAQTDPQMRLALLTTYEALEMAGYAPNRSPSTNTRRIGSFIGQTSDDYREVNASQDIDTYFITGGIRAFTPGRLNYHFGWEGPSYSIDTACSSSAASIQLACTSLLAGECDMAIGGGVNFLTASDLFAGLSRGSFLSKTGGCKTFDDEADGYVRADAVGVIVLKHLDAAVKDRDNILAVLKCAVTNHSAEAVSITHPHAETQERLFKMALSKAGLGPNDIDYAELHGTGTQAGDATESGSVTNVLARGRSSSNPLYIGTVKPNLGHGEAGSGVTSLIKAVLMMRYNVIPPHVGIKGKINHRLPPLKELNTYISFNKIPFYPRSDGDGKRRILINNFDAAGGNTSIIIEDPPVLGVEGVDPRNYHIVAVSGKTAGAVLNNSKRLLEYILNNPGNRMEDIAYTTTARRMHHPMRQAHVVESLKDLAAALNRSIGEDSFLNPSSMPRSVVFIFTGQGSQYISMANELFLTHTAFSEMLRKCEQICVSQGNPTFLSLITDNFSELPKASPIQLHLALVSVEIAVAALWKSFGVEPTAVIGHSLGEYAALYTADVLSLHDCLYLVGKRASLMMSKCTPGTHGMLAMQVSAEDASAALEQNQTACEISCFNSPVATVISGPKDQIEELEQDLKSRAVKYTNLDVQFAFHSTQMDIFLDEYAMVARKIRFAKPKVPVASTLLGEIVTTEGIFSAEYLASQTRKPVRFSEALSALRKHSHPRTQCIWIEAGPNPICLGLVHSNLGNSEILLPSLKKNEPDWKILSTSVARAYSAGLDIDWTEFHRPYERSIRLVELPRSAFDLKNYWIQYEGDWALRKGNVSSKLCEARAITPPYYTTSLHRIESESKSDTAITVTFSSHASEPKLNQVLRGHLVNGTGLCPSSVYADMAFTAAKYIQTLEGSGSISPMDVRDMAVHKPLVIQPGDTKQTIRVQTTKNAKSDAIEVKFSSQDGEAIQDHANCTVLLGDGERWTSEWKRNAYLIQSRIDHLISASSRGEVHRLLRPIVYKLFAALVEYDEKYQGMEEVYMDSSSLEATANIQFRTNDADGQFTYSPFWIDSFAHLSGFVLNGADTTPLDSVFISHGWESMKIVGKLTDKVRYRSYVRMQKTTARGVMAGDVYLFEEDRIVAVCAGLKFQRIKRSVLDSLLPPSGVAATGSIATLPFSPVAQKSQLRRLPKHKAFVPQCFILDTIASEVGIDVRELTDDAIFGDLGVDSLLSISITAKLSEILGETVPATLFQECATVEDLNSYFMERRPAGSDTSSSSELPGNDDNAFDAMGVDSESDGDSATPYITPPGEEGNFRFIDVIRKIIASEVGIDDSDFDSETPFADLGIDSLLSLVILDTIKKQTGRVFPSSFLIDSSNLAAIESSFGGSIVQPYDQLPQLESAQMRLQQSQKPKSKAILLQGSPQAPKPALFLLPDGSGSASSYVNLPALHHPGPVYGLDSPFLSDPCSFKSSLPEISAIFVHEIRQIQPHGPYRLGGWSIGGSYAFEAASQLILEFGETVERLVLIDAPCPNRLPPLPLDTVNVLESIGMFGGLKGRTGGGEIREGVKEHFAGSINALRGYVPRALRDPRADQLWVTVLWAESGVWETVGPEVRSRYEGSAGGKNTAKDWIMEKRIDHGPGGWDALVPNAKVQCEVVRGDHFSILRRPHILELGEKLRRIL